MLQRLSIRPCLAPVAWPAAALLLSGCALTQVKPPAVPPPPAQFKETALWHQATGAQAPVPEAWWQLFGDPELDRLQGELVLGNENLKTLASQVAQAKALLDISRGGSWPTANAGLSATRGTAGTDSGGSAAPVRTSLSLTANASWEVDLWGRLSQATDAAQARLLASQHDLAAARLSVQATLTQTYLNLRAAEAQEALLSRSMAVYTRSLELARARYQTGVAAQTDVLQAQTQLRTAQIQQAEAISQRALLEHALAALLGQAPSSINLAKNGQLPAVPSAPPLLPADLLARRPDIAAATERVTAAYAQIGVSQAALLPALTLNGSLGYRGPELSDLVSGPHRVWSLGPALLQSIFDGGVRKAATEQARAQADQATAAYRQTVLSALVEVEDNLVLADQLQKQSALQAEAVAFAKRNLQITEDQYRVGTVSYVNVVLAQATALNSERGWLDLQTRQLAATNQLLKNIAGRW